MSLVSLVSHEWGTRVTRVGYSCHTSGVLVSHEWGTRVTRVGSLHFITALFISYTRNNLTNIIYHIILSARTKGSIMVKDRKTIIFGPFITEILEEEIARRGGRIGYTALVSEALAEKYAEQLKQKQLSHKVKLQQSQY